MSKNKMNRNKSKKNSYKWRIVAIILLLLVTGAVIWNRMRATTAISFAVQEEMPRAEYGEYDAVMNAISLSYLVYGCEMCENLSGTVSEILDQNEMGIITENFGVKRADQDDPATALFDTSEFIKRYVGDYRFLTDSKDSVSGFYGAAFCDDENRCIWISYSGSVDINDSIACGEVVLVPGLTKQEQMAVDLIQEVMKCEEVKNQEYSIMLTGHSLGGALATEVSCISGCNAITINGADGIAIDKMNSILGEHQGAEQISNYVTCPTKDNLEGRDFVQRLMFLGSYKAVDLHLFDANEYTDDTHCVFSFLTFENDNYEQPIIP